MMKYIKVKEAIVIKMGSFANVGVSENNAVAR
jgi:hypothetical protein